MYILSLNRFQAKVQLMYQTLSTEVELSIIGN
jgi:hypothetical protein